MNSPTKKSTGLFQTVADKLARLFGKKEESPAMPLFPDVSEKPEPLHRHTPPVSPIKVTPEPVPEKPATPQPVVEKLIETPAVADPVMPAPSAETAPELTREPVVQPSSVAPLPPIPRQKRPRRTPRHRRNDVDQNYSIPDLPREQIVAVVTEFVKNHLADEQLSVETMAAQLNTSRTGLYQDMHDEFRLTPANFIMKMRMQHAEVCLRQGLTVREVSLRCGFSDPKYFSKVFKKHYGILPSNYANSQQ